MSNSTKYRCAVVVDTNIPIAAADIIDAHASASRELLTLVAEHACGYITANSKLTFQEHSGSAQGFMEIKGLVDRLNVICISHTNKYLRETVAEVRELYEDMVYRAQLRRFERFERVSRHHNKKSVDRVDYKKMYRKLVIEEVGDEDIYLLARTIRLHKTLNITTFLASSDTHFSPIITSSEVNAIIPKEIRARFGVICNHPDFITNLLTGKKQDATI